MNHNGLFIKILVAVTSVLITAGVIASIALAFNTNTKLTAISFQIDSLQSSYVAQAEELENTKITVKALELLLGTVKTNHTAIRTEFADLSARLRELERIIQQKGH